MAWTVCVKEGGDMRVTWDGKWHTRPKSVEIRLGSRAPIILHGDATGEALVPLSNVREKVI